MNIWAFVGIDLALRHTGVAVLTLEGEVSSLFEIETSSKMTDLEACEHLHFSLQSFMYTLFEDCGNSYQVVIEIPAGSQSAKAHGCAKMAIACYAPFWDKENDILYTPTTIKKFIGHKEVVGPARKKLNIAKAFELYPNAPWKMKNDGPMMKEEHKADALLLAHIAKEGYISQ